MNDFRNAAELIDAMWWAYFHPDDKVHAARVAVIDAREALRKAQTTLAVAEAHLRAAEAGYEVRRLEAAEVRRK